MPTLADPSQADRIDVVAVELDDRLPRWTSVPGPVIATWTGDRVGEVLRLVEALPADEQMRCFLPRYGTRVFAGDTVLAEVAFCFRCHNAMAYEPAPGHFTFDPESPPARALLALFRTP
jgi:hypothetical protein